jgi:hypothetical protein
MVRLTFNPAKVWTNYLLAVVAGIVVVIVLASVWRGGALAGGIGGIIGVAGMLLIGTIKRSARKEPVVILDAQGLSLGPIDTGVIPWRAIRSAEIKGVQWVTGQRLVIEYAGTAPRVRFMDKLNWGVQSKQRGEIARLTIGFLDQTNRSISEFGQILRSRLPARTT